MARAKMPFMEKKAKYCQNTTEDAQELFDAIADELEKYEWSLKDISSMTTQLNKHEGNVKSFLKTLKRKIKN